MTEVAAPSSLHPSLTLLPTRSWQISDRPRLWGDLRCAYQVNRWQREYDLLHAHGLRAAAVVAVGSPRRWVFSIHNLLPDRLSPVERMVLQRAAAGAQAILPVSHAIAQQWLNLFPHTTPRCTVVPGGVHVPSALPDKAQARAQLGVPLDVPLLLCVARLMPDKGVDILLHALTLATEWFALVVGEGPDREPLEHLQQRLGLSERVRFTGYLPDLSPAWAACDLAVVPSRREGLGLFALEALAASKPVVASRVGGLPEVVRHGETGWLVPPEDPQALAEALGDALRYRGQWGDMGRLGRADVQARFSWRRTAEQLYEVYRRLVNR